MRKTTLFAIGVLTALSSFIALGSPPQNPGKEQHSHDPIIVRPLTHPRGLSKVSLASVRPFYRSKSEWQHIIDSTWGPGLPLPTKLAIFDDYATVLAKKFDGFLSSGLNWDSLRTHYRSKIDSSASRGRFAAIMARFAMSLRDGHTSALDTIVAYSPLSPGVPLLVLSPFATAEHFGAVLTTLPDSSALVLRTIPNHPLGLEPGDIVLGYEGVPWKRLVKELLDAELPVNSGGVGARSAETHTLLRNVGNNWHLFETIDILKYSTKETVHLSVYPLLNLPSSPMMGNEQLEIAGIAAASYFVTYNSQGITAIGQPVNYGKLPMADVGYIRLLGEWPTNTTDAKFAEAVNALWNARGLIIDMRWNSGGWAVFDQAFARMFSQRLWTINDAYRASPATFDLAPVAASQWYVIPGAQGTIYDRPIAVLLGPTCVSMGDVTAQRLRYHPMVRFFGKPPIASLGDNEFLDRYQFWKLHYSMSDMYHLSQPGVYLNRSEFPIDEPVWFTADGVVKGEDDVVKRALQWISGLAYAHDVLVANPYVRPGRDSVTVTAVWTNPDSHVVNASLIVTDLSNVYQDSVAMVNDGWHGDGLPGDSIWGARFGAPSAEGFYALNLSTRDQTIGSSRFLPAVRLFTTAGPVECVGDTAYGSPQWGLTVAFRLKVGNRGSTTLTPAIGGTIRALDTVATIVSGSPFAVGDITPGEVRLSSMIGIAFSASSAGTKEILFELKLSSNTIEFWRDTLVIRVVNPTGIVRGQKAIPTTYSLEQNYPNPFNPSTTIRYGLPHKSAVWMSVFNTLGQQVAILVQGDEEAGYHEVKFEGSGLSSGVYFYRLRAGDFVQARKLLLVR